MRSVLVHGVLAAGGLVLAWLVWVTPEEERSPDEVELVDCAPERVAGLELTIEQREVKLEARGQGDERTYWITVTRTPEDGEPSTREFVGSAEKVEEYLAKVAPLRALRSLGELDEETAGEVELGEEPAGTFVYRCGEQTHGYAVGGSAFGTGDRYLREQDGKTAYLLGADSIRDLQSAEALLMQRELNDFEWSDVESLVLRAEDRERRLLQRNRNDPQRAEWVDAEEPDRRNELFGNWLDRLTRLRVQDYLEPEAQPGSDVEDASVPPVEVLTIEYQAAGGDALGRMELARVETQPVRYYARTTATRAWVTVPRSVAQQVEDDGRSVVGLEPIERPEPEPEAPPASPHAPAEGGEGAAAGSQGAAAQGEGAAAGSHSHSDPPAAPGAPTPAAPAPSGE